MSDQLAPCLRTELGVPMLVFGGVLLLSTAFCGVIDSLHPHTFAEEVKVVRAENVIGGEEADFLAACNKENSRGPRDVRCRHKNLQSASLH